jgi:endo-1,4-beta-xylanase
MIKERAESMTQTSLGRSNTLDIAKKRSRSIIASPQSGRTIGFAPLQGLIWDRWIKWVRTDSRRIGRAIAAVLVLLFASAGGADAQDSLARQWQSKFLFGFGGLWEERIRKAIDSDDPVVTGLIERHAAILGINCFYGPLVHPGPGQWRWEGCDRHLAYGERLGVPLRGHVLWWPYHEWARMGWMLAGSGSGAIDRDAALALMEEHIRTVVARYRGRIRYWDVVNEAVKWVPGDGSARGGWRPAVGAWGMVPAEEMIERAFRVAHAADPDARLFYNDFQEWVPGKRDAILALVSRLRARNVPIHGLGLQAHLTLDTPLDQIDEAMRLYAATGLEIHVTELDIDMNPDGTLNRLTSAMEIEQALRYRAIFDLYARFPAVTAVMTWNVTDDSSWLLKHPKPRANWPLLFDAAGRPKESAHMLLRGP